MLPQTVITNVLFYSGYPSFLLCNLLRLQGVKNVSNSVFVPQLLYLSMFWEQMLRIPNIQADTFNTGVWTYALNPQEESHFQLSVRSYMIKPLFFFLLFFPTTDDSSKEDGEA